MNKQEYKEYKSTVEDFFTETGLMNLTRTAACEESYFSWEPCEVCGTTLGGDRIEANGWNSDTEEVENYEICTDCEYYIEYGQLDDMTMMDIEAD